MSQTINTIIRDRARITPDRAALVEGDRTWTFAELEKRSDELAAGLGHGERVSTLTGNTGEHVALMFACAKAGAILHPISWRLAPAEIAYQLDDAEPSRFVVEDEYRALGDEALALAKPLQSRSRSETDCRVRADDPLLLIYTSGTTGRPKGALLTHANCFWTNLSFDLATGVRPDDVVLQVLPQFHCGGWNVQPLLAWWKGAKVVLERGFEAERALELIEHERVTTMMGVPANYLFMAQAPGFEDADLSSLRLAVVGGAPMPEALLGVWAARGVDIVQGYGLTEAAPNVLCLAPEDARRKAGYAGKPYPYVECDLSDEAELLVRGPNVFPGYWRNDEATVAAFRDGWLLTGDIAERDDEGNYRILGRLKDMVVSGGENVYPAEIEAVLHEHSAVTDAAVVGIPDERWGEVCAAFVVLSTPVSEDELREHCRSRLARFKVPKTFTVVDSLPRNSMGKIQKSELTVHA
ncbi:MAG TPA: long-chain fatty acid--CoA ligase [Gaiellaceae bacterium]|jgi:fatty-acyl-CoA synthase|nr:long-chain fatty acid--CoA ligase [Gaiellaceae bacterium]